MKQASRSRPRTSRGGFTLIELIVVVTIIAILAAMSVPAVLRALGKAKEVKAHNEISQLSQAMGAFKAKYGRYPPSTVDLSGGDPDSKSFLQSCWPRMSPGALGGGSLQGSEVLVFFLGGKQSGGICLGYSDNPQNPFDMKSIGTVRPFYNFPKERLKNISGSYLSFLDAFSDPDDPSQQSPYVYFGTGRSGNDYQGSCMGLSPFMDAPGHFINPDSFQIISAGADHKFGSGGMWDPINPSGSYQKGSPGYDDIANFHGSKLGVSAD